VAARLSEANGFRHCCIYTVRYVSFSFLTGSAGINSASGDVSF
jgi:hypothetical protein